MKLKYFFGTLLIGLLSLKVSTASNMSGQLNEMDIDKAEAILRVEKGTNVSELSTKELKRDLLVFAKQQPKLFLDLAEDENVELRNFGIFKSSMIRPIAP